MARLVSIGSMESSARRLSDTENDPNISSSEVLALLNRHLTEVYDRLVDAGPADYYAQDTTVTTIAGTTSYAVPADFRNLVGVFVRENSTERRELLPMPHGARGRYKPPTGVWTLDVEYVPAPPTLSAEGISQFDGVSGWDELIVNLTARDIMTKRESDPSVVMNNIARIEARILARSRDRDKGHPKRITDLDEVQRNPYPWGATGATRLACYRLRAGNIELYEPQWGAP